MPVTMPVLLAVVRFMLPVVSANDIDANRINASRKKIIWSRLEKGSFIKHHYEGSALSSIL